MYFVYIIETEDETYYTGMTNDLARRMNEHLSNSSRSATYLRAHKPVYVVYLCECRTRGDAMRLEIRLKKDYKLFGKWEISNTIAKDSYPYEIYSNGNVFIGVIPQDDYKTEILEYNKSGQMT